MNFPDGLSEIEKNKEDFKRRWKCLGCGYIGGRTRHYFPNESIPCAFFEYDERWWELVDKKEAIEYEKEKMINQLIEIKNNASIFNFRKMIEAKIEKLRREGK